MTSSASLLVGARESVDTLVIGGGQVGLATSYWLTQAGVEHLVVERRNRFGGGWLDRWDSFCLVAPNFVILLPGMPYAGPDPDGFMARDEVVNYLQEYAASFAAPVRLCTTVTRLATSNGHFEAHTDGRTFLARNVVLATGPYQRPKVPAASGPLPDRIQQLHSHDYRRPGQLADGAVLFSRQGVHLYGRLESATGATVRFSNDLDARLAFADRDFDEEFRPMFDAYIAAAGIDAPPDDRPPYEDFTPAIATELDLDAAGVGAVVWATGYQLDFGWVDLPVLDEWGYPRHVRGVTTHPGLYSVGLRWLHTEPSAVLAGVGAVAAHIVENIVRRA
jgi:glycine/D-amino acid oxidase-like deaminating enzyme